MSQNFLQLNTGKTELIIMGSKRIKRQFETVPLCLDGLAIQQSACVRNLGVLLDPLQCFDHVRSITKIAFFRLRDIAKIRLMLSAADAEPLIHASISSRQDYCNSVLGST